MPNTPPAREPSDRMIDLAVAVDRLSTRDGYAPTFRELAAEIGVTTPRAHLLAHRGRERGLVTFRDGCPRTIRVIDQNAIRRKRTK